MNIFSNNCLLCHKKKCHCDDMTIAVFFFFNLLMHAVLKLVFIYAGIS